MIHILLLFFIPKLDFHILFKFTLLIQLTHLLKEWEGKGKYYYQRHFSCRICFFFPCIIKYVKIAKQMVTIHVKLVHMLPTISTQNPAICLCVHVSPTLHKALNQKSKKEDLLAATFSCCCCCWKCCCHPCCFLGEGPLPKCNPVFCVASMWQKSLFAFLEKNGLKEGKGKGP
jgi:hypothetical protein